MNRKQTAFSTGDQGEALQTNAPKIEQHQSVHIVFPHNFIHLQYNNNEQWNILMFYNVLLVLFHLELVNNSLTIEEAVMDNQCD